ncbi:hypothetical protein OS493_015343 [Desmophyllum pertusum]|uniref:Secreted protein n=1 Tax=Desmophyllum pertusum TaxID=174260 RepID=A0A9W9ZD72_9CNID|nr:hypothetical protein OS493_015343 [Desmophyllum pertusum]
MLRLILFIILSFYLPIRQRCPLPATNKRFLHNVLVSTLEPRKKKARPAGTEPGTNEKVKNCRPVHKDSYHKNTNKYTNKADKDRCKHHKHKSKRKCSNQ